MTKRAPKKIGRLRAMAEDGATSAAIARELGVSAPCVANWAAEEGIVLLTRSQAMKKLHADPAFAAARDARGRERMKKHDDFLENAALYGEEDAARHVRRLKHEAALA